MQNEAKNFLNLTIFSFIVICLNLKGDISYTNNPRVGVANSSFTKYVDVVTDAVSWYYPWLNGTVTVYVSAGMKGVGQGQGTLKSISIFGNSIDTWQGEVSDAGSKNSNGSWRSGTGSAGSQYPISLPDGAEDGDSWSWSAGGSTSIWPWEWHESVTVGGRIQIPSGVSGSYSTTGSWQKGTSITRSANSRSGKITLDIQYKCSKCSSYGDTKAAVCGSGMGVTCPSSSCDCKGSTPSYGCAKSAYYDWCNDAGTCTVGSSRGVPGPQCGIDFCCCDHNDSGSGGSTPPTGSGSTPPSGGGSTPPPPPTDNTPNCQDCTSDCSSPCSCTNSGTCGGTVSTPPPPPPPPEPEPEPEPRTCSTERVWRGGTHKCDSAGSCGNTGNAFQSTCGRGRCRCSS
jgi:hypothetical protein